MAAAAPAARGPRHLAGCAAPWHGTGERGDWAWSGCSVGKQRHRKDFGRPRAVHHFWNPEVNNNWEKKIIGHKDGTKFWSSEEMMGIRQNSWDHLLN